MGIRPTYVAIKQSIMLWSPIPTMFVDLLLSKHNHNGAAVQRFLLVLGPAIDARKLRSAAPVCSLLKCVGCLYLDRSIAATTEFTFPFPEGTLFPLARRNKNIQD